jgi:hypothetical protein
MSDTPVVPERDDPDFSLAGTALLEWLGQEPHEATLKAAEQAFAVPDEPFIVAVFHEPELPVARFARAQRRALRVWWNKAHPEVPGRIRLSQRHELEPASGQDVTTVIVEYEPKWKPVRNVVEKLDKLHGLPASTTDEKGQ